MNEELTDMIHEGIQHLGGSLVDVTVFTRQVGRDSLRRQVDHSSHRVAQYRRYVQHHLQCEQIHLGVGVFQARDELVKYLKQPMDGVEAKIRR